MEFATMLKTLNNYLRYSGIWSGLVINPFHWDFRYQFLHPDDLNPNMRGVYISFGPIWIRVVIDDGTW
jgi:hypothetical protein